MGRAQASKVARPPMNHLQSPAPQNSTAEAPGMDRCYLQSSRLEGYLCSLTNPYGTLSPSDLAWKGCVTKVDGLWPTLSLENPQTDEWVFSTMTDAQPRDLLKSGPITDEAVGRPPPPLPELWHRATPHL
ncbi:hypothetical protein FOYG_00507 [Fusarium oxysporum NRRL 32931]|uniref:Uncharacterized protein n=1 Tax=Fusarium oxysporum NRRL 32931 TaxID=660029 RepID=W9J119_FUSOX|nr:hypothetical protein FOYG_00507 [Fusarium oxysporum NRRL 32931]